ncbi:MAG: patatin-like phospholipase family protein [Bacteroidota bacterium]
MVKKIAFVLAGGGGRGALQVGALRALLEAGIQPDFFIGTSIGAVNSAFLALHGFSAEGLDLLAAAWLTASQLDILPANYLWLAVRAMFGRSLNDPARRLQDFFIANGLTPDLCFSDVKGPRLFIVSADLNTGRPVIHGESADDNLLEALLLSTALPPWFMPSRKQGRYLMDGGVVSNLPVESALKLGATHTVALDLGDTREIYAGANPIVGFLDRLSTAVEKREADLELELARARGVPVLYLGLLGDSPIPYWDFHHTETFMELGYEIARRTIQENDASEFLR